MSNKKVVTHEIEVTEVFTLKGTEGYGAIDGHIIIIPDQSVQNGFKKTYGNKIFISIMNYKDIRGAEAKGIITGLSLLKEVISEN